MHVRNRGGSAVARVAAPHVHLVAHPDETLGDLPCVVADAADVRRVLARDDVPDAHAEAFPRASLRIATTEPTDAD